MEIIKQFEAVWDVYEVYYISLCKNGADHPITVNLKDCLSQELILFKALTIIKFGENIPNE